MSWDVWGELARRQHITLEWGYITGADAFIDDLGAGQRRITLDARLDRRERRAALAHELVHDERNILFHADTPAGLVQTEERCVRAEVVQRLCPADTLAALMAACVETHGVISWRDVADQFDVPEHIATEALVTLARAHHPSGSAA